MAELALLLLLLLPNFFSQISTAASAADDKEQCDLSSGEWIPDPSELPYTNTSCHFIMKQLPQWSCMDNEQRDKTYLHWKWQPYGCHLPPFDPHKFLDSMRCKKWGLIGDSLLRNQFVSLVCLLSKVEQPIDISKDSSSLTWFFPSYNFTAEHVGAPLLLNANVQEKVINGYTRQKIDLQLDALESNWTTRYSTYDYMVFTGGRWFEDTQIIMREKGKIIGCHNCQGLDGNLTELGSGYPYRRALQTAFDFITSSDHKPVIFLRTWNPDHFEYGRWDTGGFCNRTMPYRDGNYNGKLVDREKLSIDIEEFAQAKALGSERGIQIKLLDITHMSLLRPDAHPNVYKSYPKVKIDCLHWCLPGTIDIWNKLMVAMLQKDGDLELRQAY